VATPPHYPFVERHSSNRTRGTEPKWPRNVAVAPAGPLRDPPGHKPPGEMRELMDPETKPETPEAIDPMKFTRDRFKEVQKVWVDFAKTKLGPYVEKSQKWVKRSKPPADVPAN
jgi:hypothetical protein